MKKLLFSVVFVLSLAALASCADGVEPAIEQDQEIEAKIEKILRRMTLEEKVGQMSQITITVIQNNDKDGNPQWIPSMLDSVITKYKVGSILNVINAQAQTRELTANMIKVLQEKSMKEIGIPCLYGLDQIHGASYIADATLFPQEINVAATFDRKHAFNMGQVTAYESRAALNPWSFSPTLDLGRDQRWPRLWESYGESEYLQAEMGVAQTKGMQGEDPNHVGPYHMAVCIKHYMAYGVPVSGRDRTPSSVTDSDMRERYFEPFKECIQAGALSLMANSSSNEALPFHANYEYLTKWLKEELNWDGMIVTDWADIDNLYTRERIATSRKDAVRLAINAGIDMAMIPNDWQFCIDLVELVKEGAVPMSRIDDAVRRVLRLKFRLGLFDNPNWDLTKYEKFGSKEFQQMSYQAAVESEVLLKNEGGLLPLKKGTRILVTGPNGNEMRCLNGGWSYTWQGDKVNDYTAHFNTIYEALRQEYGSDNVRYEAGVEYVSGSGNWQQEKWSDASINRAVQAAKGYDVIVACIGENSYCETPGNVEDINLSVNQKRLVKALAGTGKPVVLIYNGGRPRIINDIEPLAQAVVNVILPGNYGGDALAALISGRENFSGKLPYTYPKYINMLSTYDYKVSEVSATMEGVYNYDARIDVLWPFGYGLSYTTFGYSGLSVNKVNFRSGDVLEFEVKVTNTGKVAGKESVLLYSSDLFASLVPDSRRLRAFEKIELGPGESQVVKLVVPATDLAFVNYDGKWTLEEGDFRIQVGDQVVMVHCDRTVVWDEPNID
ncbi:MAG: glycoside hydrolase family 3 C-terminal domain-containing protein [Bacteroidales bacterium]|nr:glycoside hydrolase family 3 C-terminal domain-containing protein [Bacteroidales bacterium]